MKNPLRKTLCRIWSGIRNEDIQTALLFVSFAKLARAVGARLQCLVTDVQSSRNIPRRGTPALISRCNDVQLRKTR